LFGLLIPELELVLPDPVLVLLPVVLELPGLAVPLEVPLDPAPLFAAPPPPGCSASRASPLGKRGRAQDERRYQYGGK
jgi:hypothetical protein